MFTFEVVLFTIRVFPKTSYKHWPILSEMFGSCAVPIVLLTGLSIPFVVTTDRPYRTFVYQLIFVCPIVVEPFLR